MFKPALPPEPPLPDVPPRQLTDFDFFAVHPVDGDLHLGWKRLHDGPDIFYTPRNGGHWVVTRYADGKSLFEDTEHFSNAGVAMSRDAREMQLAPGEADLPEHTSFRTLVNPSFGPKPIRELEAQARQLTVELIEGFRAERRCEFRSAFAQRMPIHLFLSMMDLPQNDAQALLPAADLLTRDAEPQSFHSAMMTMMQYLQQRVVERQAQPGDDFISRLLCAEVGGRPMDLSDVIGLSANVMFGGLDTVVATMGFFMNFLARHPGHQRQLVDDPSLIPAAVDELMRRHAIANFGRLCIKEVEIAGVRIRLGDLVLLPTGLLNLDERHFLDPLTVNFQRRQTGLLNFGSGIHRCLGLHLARLELRVMLEEWMPRIRDFRIADGETVKCNSGRVNAISHLPLVWT